MAQDIIRTKNNYEFELKAGLNFLGGTAPMGLPVEIRSIDGYKPKFGGSFEGVATRWFGEQHGDAEWGISAGLRIENRGMSTKATVKSFFTVGFSWRAYKHFHVNADLNWGFTNIFKKDFKAISFNMYPIYRQAGFGYQF
ncbi:hypothetical protein IX308_000586 [Porphyromonas levii]|uniref:outer membrane beta-barrel protein n=1 Tax=Porphyromonas levii TaxID=28114 RepID=UPI0031FE6FF8|nr:hypothetical protein [Porphyromonas levii]